MNIIKDKLKENYNYQGYLISYYDEQIYFKMKNISYLQKQFINSNLNDFLSNDEKLKELIFFLTDIKEEDFDKIIKEEETTERFFDIIFKETNLNFNFYNIIKEKLNTLKITKDSVFNIFLRYLIDNGINLINLENKNELEILDLALRTAIIKNDEPFFEILNLISLDKNKKPIDNELTELINDFISENKSKQKKQSAFDMLGEL